MQGIPVYVCIAHAQSSARANKYLILHKLVHNSLNNVVDIDPLTGAHARVVAVAARFICWARLRAVLHTVGAQHSCEIRSQSTKQLASGV